VAVLRLAGAVMTADTAAPLWARSATALAAAIRFGEVTSREVVDAGRTPRRVVRAVREPPSPPG